MSNRARALSASLIARARNQWGEGSLTSHPDHVLVKPPGHPNTILVPTRLRNEDISQMKSIEMRLMQAGLNGQTGSEREVLAERPAATWYEKLRQERLRQGLKQTEIAELLNYDPTTITRLETAGVASAELRRRYEDLLYPNAQHDPDTAAIMKRLPDMKAPPRREPVEPPRLTVAEVSAWLTDLVQANRRLAQENAELRSQRPDQATLDKARRWDEMQKLLGREGR